jgi:MoaA/NifB/PqqE/SkfB family radical SAM enzyme
LKALREFKAMGTHGVVLEGGGEPTLHKNFEFIVREIKKIGLAVGLITNGVQPLSNDVIKEFEWIRVSLDASTKEEYKAAKGVDAFEKVLANLAAWSKVKEKCVIGVGYLISSYSITDIYGITQRLRDIEVDYVQIRTLDDKEDRNIPIDWKMPPVNDLQTETFKVYTHQLDWEVDASGNLGLPCRAHNLSSVIGSDGSVFFCCRLHSVHLPTGESLGIIGNIYEESVEAIWTGKKREKYIRGMLDPNICQRFCPSCRHTKYNLMIHNLLHTRTPNFI